MKYNFKENFPTQCWVFGKVKTDSFLHSVEKDKNLFSNERNFLS